jgi:16S rRNA (cytidine1402-2'-O)-methyltransferase
MPSNPSWPKAAGAPAAAGPGTLFVVATPIGHLGDITLRALDTLTRADLIAAEDTRHTRKLLAAHHIAAKRLIAYHEHNESRRTPELLARLEQGARLALVSNAGTPAISDPGFRLVRAAVENRIPVVPIPGASAAMSALCASGLPSDAFTFIGFAARKKARRAGQLQALAGLAHTLIFYESPRRVVGLLEHIQAVMGDRPVVVAREMTKLYEEFVRGPISEVTAALRDRSEIKGECTILVQGAAPAEPASDQALREALAQALERGPKRPLSDIARQIATEFAVTRKAVYDLALQMRIEQR